jgi:hypothetical protein
MFNLFGHFFLPETRKLLRTLRTGLLALTVKAMAASIIFFSRKSSKLNDFIFFSFVGISNFEILKFQFFVLKELFFVFLFAYLVRRSMDKLVKFYEL